MKKWLGVSLVGIMLMGSVSLYANDLDNTTPIEVTTNQKEEASEGVVSSDQIVYRTPISLAELMYVIVTADGEALPQMMDTHYAMPAMMKAEELGILKLEDYPMDTWLEPLSEEAFNGFITKAMQSGKVDRAAVSTALNQVMVDEVTVDGESVDLGDANIRHYQGQVMVPLRPIAEALGFEIKWNYQTSTATLSNGRIKSDVQVGFDHYYYTSEIAIGMSAPMKLGVAPRLVEGTLYVPYKYFDLFATSEVADGNIAYTSK